MPKVLKKAISKIKVPKINPAAAQEEAPDKSEDFSVCPSSISHPSVGPGEHHPHNAVVHNIPKDICCKCGMNLATGEKFDRRELGAFRQSFW